MRSNSKWFIAVNAAIFIAAGCQSASAAFIGLPNMLGQTAKRISFGSSTPAPKPFTQFCLRYADQCKTTQIVFRGGPVYLSEERWDDLKKVNKTVNAAIVPKRNLEGLAGAKWLINPASGDCNDYAVSKRAELLKRGWPARALLLGEVLTAWGDLHLILVVRTSVGDLVLDNLTTQIRPWTRTGYLWLRMQTPKNPNYWAFPSEVRTTLIARDEVKGGL